MPDETLENIENKLEEMERQSESETPLADENEKDTQEKPLAFAKLTVNHPKTCFGKSF